MRGVQKDLWLGFKTVTQLFFLYFYILRCVTCVLHMAGFYLFLSSLMIFVFLSETSVHVYLKLILILRFKLILLFTSYLFHVSLIKFGLVSFLLWFNHALKNYSVSLFHQLVMVHYFYHSLMITLEIATCTIILL